MVFTNTLFNPLLPSIFKKTLTDFFFWGGGGKCNIPHEGQDNLLVRTHFRCKVHACQKVHDYLQEPAAQKYTKKPIQGSKKI